MSILPFALLALPLAAVAAEPPVNPVPRAMLSTLVERWTFDQGDEGWSAEHQCSLTPADGVLQIRSTGNDPFFHRPVELAGGRMALKMRVRCRTAGPGSVYWTTEQSPQRGQDKAVELDLQQDGQWHETSARFDAPGKLTDVRIDPGDAPGEVEIDWIELVREEPHPLTIDLVEPAADRVWFTVANHRSTPLRFSAAAADYQIDGNGTVRIERPVDGRRPIEAVTLEINSTGLPPVRRTIFLHHAQAAAEWVEMPLEGFALRVARDGSAARLDRDGQLLAFLGPLVHCDGKIPELSLVAETPAVRFEGHGVALTLTPAGKEIRVSIESQEPCEGPVVRVLGGLEQGLLAGLEYLGKGERSSSKLDIETDEHLRFAPDPLKVTMPLMTFATDRATVAVTWNDMRLQPVYATPNFFDATDDHRMALRGTKIEAAILLDRVPMEETIVWAVKKGGLPPLPQAPRTPEEQRTICLKGLNGPLRTPDGWGHCAQEGWGRQPFADMASTLWRLTDQAPELPRLVPGGAHVPNGTIYFVTGRAQEWLDWQRGQAASLVQSQQPDGSYRYDGEYRRGHFENTASGVCARPAMVLLEYAYVTGDKEAREAGLRTLEYMKRFRTPRGAQTWEVPLHTPDQLASAHLVWAYVRGYELTGNREYLDLARKWALSGVPFTYLWERYPIMLYSTPPVFGATFWRHSWFGLPVQWVGGVYAYALTLLAPYDQTLDWNHLARGILRSAQQQQYPDGPHVGLLPDSLNIPHQRRQPADINPCALVSLEMRLDGQVDFLSVATDGRHRVAAPFPVTIRDGKVHIQGRPGVNYQVLVDGQKTVDVRSQGEDVVPLE